MTKPTVHSVPILNVVMALEDCDRDLADIRKIRLSQRQADHVFCLEMERSQVLEKGLCP